MLNLVLPESGRDVRDALGACSPLLGFRHLCLLSSWHSVWRGDKINLKCMEYEHWNCRGKLGGQNIGPSFNQSGIIKGWGPQTISEKRHWLLKWKSIELKHECFGQSTFWCAELSSHLPQPFLPPGLDLSAHLPLQHHHQGAGEGQEEVLHGPGLKQKRAVAEGSRLRRPIAQPWT